MSAQKSRPPRIGEISQDGNGIPIYGMPEIPLTRSGRWDINAGIQSMFVLNWLGEEPIEFALNFELVAGVTARDREELYDYMKLWHSMAAHRDEGGQVRPPAPCTLILGEYINSVGVLKDATVVGKGPWGGSSSTSSRSGLMPTAAVFSGVFLVAPGYDGSAVSVQVQNSVTSSTAVKDRFYKS